MSAAGKIIGFIMVFGFSAAAQTPRAPVLVELFTSEGCSSCPPADSLLAQIDSRGLAIVLSEHVDYWNHDGWSDPFSSPDNTARQEAYGQRFQIESVYTPQMVIDGAVQFTGSDAARASRELTAAARHPKAAVALERTATGVKIMVRGGQAGMGVYLALADDSDESRVTAGENRGRRLRHVAVVRSLRKMGKLDKEGIFEREIALPGKTLQQRVIVFLQEGTAGRISGAALLNPEKTEAAKEPQ